MKGKLLFLGTGGSLGVPMIGCNCEVCQSDSSYNKRLRPSALLLVNNKKILIDASPDFRTQALREGINSLDGVIITHAHHDHTAGIDDLRVFYPLTKTPLPMLLSPETYADLKVRFEYIFAPKEPSVSLVSQFELSYMEGAQGHIQFEGIPIGFITYKQGGMLVNGLRVGDLAFLSDIKEFPDSIFPFLDQVKTLVISALRFTSSPLHFTVDEAVDFANKTKAEKVWFTHIAHELNHDFTNAYLPSHIRLAYDGLTIPFEI